MTAPVGHPDGQDYATWQAVVIENSVVTAAPGANPLGIMTLVNFASLYVSLTPNADGVTAIVTYYQDALGADPILVYTLQPNSHSALAVVIPNFGPYAQVTIENAQLVSETISVSVVPVNMPVTEPTYVVAGNMFATGFQTLALSASATWFLPLIAPGPCFWWFQPNDATGKLNLAVTIGPDVAMAGDLVLEKFGPTAELEGVMYLSDQPYTWTVSNTDATAAHSYRLAVIAPGK